MITFVGIYFKFICVKPMNNCLYVLSFRASDTLNFHVIEVTSYITITCKEGIFEKKMEQYGKSCMNITNSRGPSMEHWGTPDLIEHSREFCSFNDKNHCLSVK